MTLFLAQESKRHFLRARHVRGTLFDSDSVRINTLQMREPFVRIQSDESSKLERLLLNLV